MTDTACIVLAAGKGTRMRSQGPKVMHKVAGRPLIAHAIASLLPLAPQRIVAVLAPGMDAVKQAALACDASIRFAEQAEQKGTGHAVACARGALEEFAGNVLIAYGDTPLILPETLKRLLAALDGGAALATLGMHMDNPTGYGRLITHGGDLERIVECKDANAQEKAVTLCNSGVMAVRADALFSLLEQVGTNNASGEYYLTDIVGIARTKGLSCRVVEADAAELQGINTRAQLAEAEGVMQRRLRARAMEGGVTLTDPGTVFFSADTQIGADSVVQPFVTFGHGVKVGQGVEIRSFSHIEGATIGDYATIGPFARLRPGAALAEEAHIGNFVEIKNASVAKGAKVNHLTYIGDAEIGEAANIGAGTITCNYDGFNKHKTVIGAGAFIGSNSSLVAPVSIGEGAIVGAGSVITQDVPADALAVARGTQEAREGAAARIRERKKK